MALIYERRTPHAPDGHFEWQLRCTQCGWILKKNPGKWNEAKSPKTCPECRTARTAEVKNGGVEVAP